MLVVPALLTGQLALQAPPRTPAVVHGALKDWRSMPGLNGLERAFEYLSRTDLAALPIGRTDLDGDNMFVTVSDAETKSPDLVPFEAHRRYIDIQVVVRGQESIAIAAVSRLTMTQPYDAAKDIEFFAVPPEALTLALRAGDFAVFTPGDAHRPSMHLDGPHVTRKAVVKVRATASPTVAKAP
jgi:YhcH/YjgK/YiaL family protein